MFAIGFTKNDLLQIRYRIENNNVILGYIRYYLKDDKKPTAFNTKEEAEKFLNLIKEKNVEFINDSVKNSIVNGSNIDKSKLMIFEVAEQEIHDDRQIPNRTKEDALLGLKICTSDDNNKNGLHCVDCPYYSYSKGENEYKGTNCDVELMKDAFIYLQDANNK